MVMSFLSLLAHRAALIFAYSALSQIAAKAARPWTSVLQGVPVYRPPLPELMVAANYMVLLCQRGRCPYSKYQLRQCSRNKSLTAKSVD